MSGWGIQRSLEDRADALRDAAARTEAVGAWLSNGGQRDAALFYYGRASRLRGMALLRETEAAIEALGPPHVDREPTKG